MNLKTHVVYFLHEVKFQLVIFSHAYATAESRPPPPQMMLYVSIIQ